MINFEVPLHDADPMESLTVAELAQALQVGAAEVLQKENEGELFSVVFPRISPHRAFPAFQAWPGVAGQPLIAVLEALATKVHGGTLAYGFFGGRNDLIGGLTPLEMLIGGLTTSRSLDTWVIDALELSAKDRLAAVLNAANARRADAECW